MQCRAWIVVRAFGAYSALHQKEEVSLLKYREQDIGSAVDNRAPKPNLVANDQKNSVIFIPNQFKRQIARAFLQKNNYFSEAIGDMLFGVYDIIVTCSV